jgi:hypothetical protein
MLKRFIEIVLKKYVPNLEFAEVPLNVSLLKDELKKEVYIVEK